MKKLTNFFISLMVITSLTSCKKEAKKAPEAETKTSSYTIDQSSIKINWTAYKTTDKVAVKGEFQKVNINKTEAESANDLLNGLEFSVPISSIFSNNDDRDSKLKEFFFGVMKDPEILSGKISISDEKSGNIELKMNGVTNNLAIKFTTTNNGVTQLKAIMNLEDWNGIAAVESINKACFDLHKGADGVSRTWNDVLIEVSFSATK